MPGGWRLAEGLASTPPVSTSSLVNGMELVNLTRSQCTPAWTPGSVLQPNHTCSLWPWVFRGCGCPLFLVCLCPSPKKIQSISMHIHQTPVGQMRRVGPQAHHIARSVSSRVQSSQVATSPLLKDL